MRRRAFWTFAAVLALALLTLGKARIQASVVFTLGNNPPSM